MDDSKISVIIPIYNVKPYLQKCVLSVMTQTYRNLEIILVDDGSTDGSGELCDFLAQQDGRIKVIHQKNQGLSVARNTGLDASTGEWIAFLDSDDWIEEEMYEILWKIANQYDADISSCSTNFSLGQHEKKEKTESVITVLDSIEMIEGLLTQEIVRFEVWNKLWRKTLIGDVRFVEGQIAEDVHFDRILFLKANKMVHINQALHNYLVMRPGSTATSFKIGRLCIFAEFDELIEELDNIGAYNTTELVKCMASAYAMDIYVMAYEGRQNNEVLRRIEEIFKKYYDNSKGSSYRTKLKRIEARFFNFSPKAFVVVKMIKDRVGIHLHSKGM